MVQNYISRTATNVLILSVVTWAIACQVANAQIQLAKLFSDHMVLQRRSPIHIWGWAGSQEAVQVKFRGETQATIADATGQWEVFLRPSEAGGPFTLEVSGSNSILLNDILVGDVWIASGQSNMAMPVSGWGASMPIKDSLNEIAAANYPTLRFLTVAENASTYPLDDAPIASPWQSCNPNTAGAFSAVAYFFARDLQQIEKIPIGIIVTAWGGTPIESWTSVRALSEEPSLMPVFGLSDAMNRKRALEIRIIAHEAKEDEALRISGKVPPSRLSHRNILSWQPGALFNGMVAPLNPLPIRGVIWYQGESNTDPDRAPLYTKTFTTMINDWRREWHDPSLPFLFVQISSFARAEPSSWSVVREAQRHALQLASTAMVVSADVGDPSNVHPANKQAVGARLALAARAVAYGESIEFSGPLYHSHEAADGRITVWFDHADGLKSVGDKVIGFELAGNDRKFVNASASIAGKSVVVESPAVKRPVYVRYAWAAAPLMNLINSAGLPASPFTSEEDYERKGNMSN